MPKITRKPAANKLAGSKNCSDELYCSSDLIYEIPPELSESEKLKYLADKCVECQAQNDKTKKDNYELQKKIALFTEEFHQMEADRNRLITQKEKLESLCRELQKYANEIKEENISRVKNEEERRKEIADQLQASITEVQKQLTVYQDSNETLRNENNELSQKLKKFIEQYEAKEEHATKVMQAKDLEIKLAEAKYNQKVAEAEQEKICAAKRIVLLENKVKILEDDIKIRIEEEGKMRGHLENYGKKYREFNKCIEKNSKIVQNAHQDIDKFNKKWMKAETEAVDWFHRWETLSGEHVKLIEDHAQLTQELELKAKQNEKLSQLCRTLRAAKVESESKT